MSLSEFWPQMCPKYCWPIPPRISHNREKFPVKKRRTFGPKCAMPVMRFLRRYARGLILSAFERNWNFMRVCRWNHWDWANRCRVICWKLISHWNWQSINASAKSSGVTSFWHSWASDFHETFTRSFMALNMSRKLLSDPYYLPSLAGQ